MGAGIEQGFVVFQGCLDSQWIISRWCGGKHTGAREASGNTHGLCLACRQYSYQSVVCDKVAMDLQKRDVEGKWNGPLACHELLVHAQVYAAYKYRRDLAEAAKVAGMMGRSRQLKRDEAEHLLVRNNSSYALHILFIMTSDSLKTSSCMLSCSFEKQMHTEGVGISSIQGQGFGQGSICLQADEVGWGDGGEADVALDPPTVRQAIGWSFALRNIRRLEAEEAAEQLRRETGAEAVRDVKVSNTFNQFQLPICSDCTRWTYLL